MNGPIDNFPNTENLFPKPPKIQNTKDRKAKYKNTKLQLKVRGGDD